MNAKRKQIKAICDENRKRVAKSEAALLYNGIEVGTEYSESSFIEYLQSELRKVSAYLSGADNQGKAYASISFRSSGSNAAEEWKFENIDLKYKEYVEALIDYDRRADEALLSAVGMDSSISSVSKEGVISKSGSDVFYNYLIYLMSANPMTRSALNHSTGHCVSTFRICIMRAVVWGFTVRLHHGRKTYRHKTDYKINSHDST